MSDINDIEYVKKHLGDRMWRLNNLYYIRNERGEKVLFKPNDAQQTLLKNFWYMNIIPKARQLGVCLDPETRVLKADLTWVPIKSLLPGDELVSVDEYPKTKGKGAARKMRTGVVEAVKIHKREKCRITFDDGRSVICTPQHPWLTKKTNSKCEWRSVEGDITRKNGTKKRITVGTKVRWVTKLWEDVPSYEDGWMGGMLDGEGSLALPGRKGASVSVSQVDNDAWQRIQAYLDKRGYHSRIETDVREAGAASKLGSKVVYKAVVSRMDEMFRLIGQTRPSRFIGKRWWEGKELPGSRTGIGWATVTKIEKLGYGDVVDIQVSEGTYIAEGFVSHNTTFFTILYLDAVLFSENKTAGIIAHKQEDMKKIFRGKILFAWENLPEWIKASIGEPTIDTANELAWDNGSSIFVSLSTRSQTPNYLHISEYGYICAHDPAKANEILTGAINSVHAGQYISIESTAEGREGHFYRLVMQAKKMHDEGKKLTPLDFKYHFFPWYLDKRYQLDGASFVEINKEDEEYFENLRNRHGINLTLGQKRWYVKKKQTNGAGMFQEFPSTVDEAFSVSLEGAYFKHEMDKVYNEKRIAFFPVDPSAPVDTAWDLGMNDQTVILFFQRIGPEIRFVDVYANSNLGLDHYVKVIREKGYRIGRSYLPHDAAVRDLSAVNGVTRQQILWDLGLRDTEIAPKIGLLEGIERVRVLFPRFRFDEKNTAKLYDALASYRKDWDANNGVWKSTPKHDGASHFADALRVLAVCWTETMSYSQEDEDVQIQSVF